MGDDAGTRGRHPAGDEHLGAPFEAAFEDVFGTPPPDELNGDLRLTVVATELDDSSERIVTFLRGFGVPVNAVFSYLEDGDRSHLARSWLAPDAEGSTSAPSSARRKRAEWNGRDWYVSYGGESGRQWSDARAHGFVSAGGGRFYTQTMRGLPEGARVSVNLPGTGYVAVGRTLAPALRFERASVRSGKNWVTLSEQSLSGSYRDDGSADDDEAEWVVPVEWLKAYPETEAYWEKGMCASQHSACKLRQEFTLERLATHFGVSDTDSAVLAAWLTRVLTLPAGPDGRRAGADLPHQHLPGRRRAVRSATTASTTTERRVPAGTPCGRRRPPRLPRDGAGRSLRLSCF